ncbi:MAG: OmpA family protein [Caulobacteraceae bacterium]|nr:OmpA family protein [Caulobacteraceae bacterium]
MWKCPFRIVAALTALLLTTPASAQDWTVAFAPGSNNLEPEAYLQARQAAAWAAQDPNRSVVVIEASGSPSEAGSGIGMIRALAMELELVRLGMSDGYIRIVQPVVSRAAPVVTLRADRSERPRPPSGYIDQMLVYFAPGSTEIPETAQYRLQIYVARDYYGERRLMISGRTDTVGTIEANRRLGERRAEAVARFLASHGVSWDKIDIIGDGETMLSRATADGVPEALNRLVSVDVRDVQPRH